MLQLKYKLFHNHFYKYLPLGPYTLWPLIDIRSMFILFTSRGIFPTACAASVWKNTFLDLHRAPVNKIKQNLYVGINMFFN